MLRRVGAPLAVVAAGGLVARHKLNRYDKAERAYFEKQQGKKLTKAEERMLREKKTSGTLTGMSWGTSAAGLSSLMISRGRTEKYHALHFLGMGVGGYYGGKMGVDHGLNKIEARRKRRAKETLSMKTAAREEKAPHSEAKFNTAAALGGLGLADRFGYGLLAADHNYHWSRNHGTSGFLNSNKTGLGRIHGKRWPFLVGGAAAGLAVAHGARALQRRRDKANGIAKDAFVRGHALQKSAAEARALSAYSEALARTVGAHALQANRRLNEIHAERLWGGMVSGQHAFAAGAHRARALARLSSVNLDKQAWAAVAARAGALFAKARPAMASAKLLAQNAGAGSNARRYAGAAWRGAKKVYGNDIASGAIMGGAGGALGAEKGQRMKGFARGATIGAASGAVGQHVSKGVNHAFKTNDADKMLVRGGKAVARFGAAHVINKKVEEGIDRGVSAAGWQKPPGPGNLPPPQLPGTAPGLPPGVRR